MLLSPPFVLLRAFWKMLSRSQMNLQQACTPISMLLWITLTRWVCFFTHGKYIFLLYSTFQWFATAQGILDQCSHEQEFKTILFSLCYFHACVAERRKFGPQGWNRKYPFNTGDLTISVNVLYNYLEANAQVRSVFMKIYEEVIGSAVLFIMVLKVPWEDLRYLFGEIMYGGHITDDWDRRLCRTYLEEYMQPNQVWMIVRKNEDKCKTWAQ